MRQEDNPVLTTVDITPSLDPSSPVLATDEGNPVLTTVDDTPLSNPSSHRVLVTPMVQS